MIFKSSSMKDTVKLYSLLVTLLIIGSSLTLIVIFDKSGPNIILSTARNIIIIMQSKTPSNLADDDYSMMEEKNYSSIVVINDDKVEEKKNDRINLNKCNMFDGRWVYNYKPDEEVAYYDYARNCPFVEEKMSCQRNGRPDFDYLKWKWEANDCDIPLFDGKLMLERLRNKRMVLAGDSLNRNMWESLACLLHSSVPSSDVQLRENKAISKLFWKSKEYNFTVEFYWSPFLIEFNLNHESSKRVLVLDKLSSNSDFWIGADIMVFNSGFWWIPNENVKRWDLFEYEGQLMEEMPMELAYERGMRTWTKWIEKNVDPKKTKVFFRSISAEHKTKTSQRWCYNKTQLTLDDSLATVYPKTLVDIIERLISGFSKFQLKYLNITKLSQFRIDAHPSIYRYKDWKNLSTIYDDIISFRPDCSHWCLPGVPDTWNRLLYASLLFEN